MGRLRTNSNATNLLTKSNLCITNVSKLFFDKRKHYIEIGCGKGLFLINEAIKNNDICYIGIDKFPTIILKAINKINNLQYDFNNLFFMNIDAANLLNFFNKNTIDKIFLNFNDPWHKKRHEKRRLTSPFFLDIYKKILKNNCVVEFKTDNIDFYNYTMNNLLNDKNIVILYRTTDLYNDVKNINFINNTPTEYEKKFVLNGITIKKIIWYWK